MLKKSINHTGGMAMSLDKIVTEILNYIQANPIGAAAAGIILLYLLIKKTKLFMIVLALCIAGVVVMLILDKLSATGIADKSFGSLREFRK